MAEKKRPIPDGVPKVPGLPNQAIMIIRGDGVKIVPRTPNVLVIKAK